MGIFLITAYKVLDEIGKPLSAREIVDIAFNKHILSSQGLTPWQTMKSKLSTDILLRGENSIFMRSGEGKFALRKWEAAIIEFKADRYKKALFDEDIVVFPASKLSQFISFSGLHQENIRLDNLKSELIKMRRKDAEEDQSVIQIVSVFIVRHNNMILTHKRTKRLPESRLHGFYSLYFGGHLNPKDISPLFNIFDPHQGEPWLMRELREEFLLPRNAIIGIEYVGLIYDDSVSVSKQHLGIVFAVKVSTNDFKIGERGFLIDAKYESLNSIENRSNDFENWSRILLAFLQKEASTSC